MTPLVAAILTLPVLQTLGFMTTLVLPLAAPVMIEELDLDPAFVGLYSGLLFLPAFFSAMSCGGFIRRFGGLRVGQFSLIVPGLCLILSASGSIALIMLSAPILGAAYALCTPTSTHILARFSPPRLAPLIFSIKQTGVPLGGILAGVAVPFLVLRDGWESAFLVMGGLCVAYTFALQPFRAGFDSDRDPAHRQSMAGFQTMFRRVLRDRRLRLLAITVFAFVGVQTSFATYFVLYLVDRVGVSLQDAGLVFSLSQGVAIFARILWGWLGSGLVSARLLLALLGLFMSGGAVALTLFSAAWPLAGIAAVGVVIATTAMGWHGLVLGEVSRMAPPEEVGGMAGGVLSFGSLSAMAYPALFGVVLGVTGSYSLGFYIAAVPALVAGLFLLSPGGAARVGEEPA